MKKRSAAVITNDLMLRAALMELLEKNHLEVICDPAVRTETDLVVVHKDPWPVGWSLGRLRQIPATTRCLLLGGSPTDGSFLMVGLPNITYVPLPVAAAELVEQLLLAPGHG